MDNNIEFQDIGKNTPYKVPDGFFEQISEKTLQRAKLRQPHKKIYTILWKTGAAAASIAALIFLGTLLFKPEKNEQKLVVQKNHSSDPRVMPKPDFYKKPINEIHTKEKVEKKSLEVKSAEDMTDVLTDLSDEELLQLAAMYKTDPFMEEALQ